jgi:hypothetical protein
MLARYLRRADTRPVRYASADHMAAMRNYIRMAVQAHALPTFQRGAVARGGVHAGRDMRAMFAELATQGDPGALMAYLDKLNDAGHPMAHERGGLLPEAMAATLPHRLAGDSGGNLHSLLAHIMGQSQQPHVLAGFHPDTLAYPETQAGVRAGLDELAHPPYMTHTPIWHGITPRHRLQGWIGDMQDGRGGPLHPLARALPNALDRAFTGDSAPGGMADLAHMLSAVDHRAGTTPSMYANEEAHGLLHRHVLPYLMGLGRQQTGGAQ